MYEVGFLSKFLHIYAESQGRFNILLTQVLFLSCLLSIDVHLLLLVLL